MNTLSKIVLYSKNESTYNALQLLDKKRFTLEWLQALPPNNTEIKTDYDLAIIDIDGIHKITKLASIFNSTPILLILTERHALTMSKITNPAIDFVLTSFTIPEIQIRAQKLIYYYKQKIQSVKTAIHNLDFKTLLNNTEEAIYIINTIPKNNFKLIGISKRMEQITGLSNHTIKNKSLHELSAFIPDKYIKQMEANYKRCLSQGDKLEVTEHSQIDGKTFKWKSLLIPIKNTTAEVSHIIGLSFDNSLLKAFNEIIAKQEAYFHSLFEASNDAIFVMEKSGRFADCNKAAVRTFKAQSKEDLKNKYPWDISPEFQPSGETSKAAAKRHIAETIDFSRYKWIHRRFDNVDIACSIQLSLVNLDYNSYILIFVQDITVQEQTQFALRKSEEQFRKLFKQMTDGFAINHVIFDNNNQPVKYIFSDVNRSFENMLSCTHDEIVGKPVEYLLPSFYEEWVELYNEIATRGITAKFEHYSIRLNKYFRVISYRTGNNKIATHFSDITAQKTQALQLENDKKNLQSQLQKLTIAINQSPVAIIITNSENKITYVNHSFTKMSGYSFEEAEGKDSSKLLKCSKNNATDQLKIRKILMEGKIWTGEIRSQRKNGTQFWDHTHIIPTLDEQGNIESQVILKEDFTEQKHTEETLRLNEKQLTTILERSPAGMAFIDNQGYIVRGNKQLSTILGTRLHEIIGQNTFDRIKNPRLLKTIKTAMDGKPAIFKGNYEVSENITRYIKAEINPISPGTSPTDVVAIIEDITDQKKYQDKLQKAKDDAEAANKAKSSFLANMSHEIRTPLNAVLGFAQLLRKNISDPLLAGYAQSIITSGNTLLHLINDILDMSKIEAGMLAIQHEPINIKHILNDLKSIFELQILRKKLQYISQIDKQLPDYLLLDDLRIRQILINLINNAIKFTESGYVKIMANAKLKTDSTIDLVITISDSGKGIEQDNIDKIFEAFNQHDNSITKEFGGSGLGLTISRRLANLLGGKLTVESELGVGSTFMLKINDVQISKQQHVIKEDANLDQMYYEHATVYIADKNPLNLEILTEIISSKVGYTKSVTTAENLVQLCAQKRPDLILMDRRLNANSEPMPAITINKNNHLNPIPIIAITASVFFNEDEDIKARGFCEFIRRPVNEVELLQSLNKYLQPKINQSTQNHIDENSSLAIELDAPIENIKTYISSQILPAIALLNQNQSLRAVKALSELLIKTDTIFSIHAFSSFGQELKSLSQKYDVAEIRAKLLKFEKILYNFIQNR